MQRPAPKRQGGTEAPAAPEAALIAITYGYSCDRRADLKQWMLALATTHDGDVPLFLKPLDGNSSDKVSLLSAVIAIQTQLREAGEEASVFVADNGVYSEPNMRGLNQAGVKWISRVSETSTPRDAQRDYRTEQEERRLAKDRRNVSPCKEIGSYLFPAKEDT